MSHYDEAWERHKSQHSRTAVRKHSFDAGWSARDAEVQALRENQITEPTLTTPEVQALRNTTPEPPVAAVRPRQSGKTALQQMLSVDCPACRAKPTEMCEVPEHPGHERVHMARVIASGLGTPEIS